jgi:O-antigen/teichoic acid export membrane protein
MLAIAVTALQRPLVNEFGTLRDVALFSVALTFYNQIKMIILSVIPVFYPSLTRFGSISEAWEGSKSKIILFSVSFFCFCLFVSIIIPWIIPILVSQKYSAAISYAQWLILFSSLSAVPALLRSMLSAQRKIRSIYIYDVSFSVFLIGLIALFLPKYGVWGMVVARGGAILLGAILISVLVHYEVRKNSKSVKNEISLLKNNTEIEVKDK